MRPDPCAAHSWDLTPKEAVVLQRELASRVREEPLESSPHLVAGIDVSVRRGRVRAAVVVMASGSLEVVEEAVWEGAAVFPYVPGLLSFRELPAAIPALEQLRNRPDLLLVDGQGRAHPRRFGLACHAGVYFDVPCVGVAKTRLIGHHDEPGAERGSFTDLVHDDEVVGSVLRTRSRVKPVFVSVGHRITLPEARDITLHLAPRYRLPEPTRLAHRLSYEV